MALNKRIEWYWGILQCATNENLAATRNNYGIFGRNLQQLEKSKSQPATKNVATTTLSKYLNMCQKKWRQAIFDFLKSLSRKFTITKLNIPH